MPLYEYECEAENGRRFEIIQKFSDAILTVCPTCGGPVRKLISSPAIQFKGSGFYITDYGKDGKKPQTPAATGSSGEGGSSKGESSAKSDAKPDAPTGGESKAPSAKATEKPAAANKKTSE